MKIEIEIPEELELMVNYLEQASGVSFGVILSQFLQKPISSLLDTFDYDTILSWFAFLKGKDE